MAEVVKVRTTDELGIETNDSWVRDFGPLFVWDDDRLVVQDFRFNGWGDKYETRDLDDAVAGKIAEALGYEDEFYFNRQFAAAVGVPPATFRRSRQGSA